MELEDLLRIKRAERPNPEFWDKFDHELHERMLQNLVKKDSWPVQFLRSFRGWMLQSMAAVATLAIAATLSIRPFFYSSIIKQKG